MLKIILTILGIEVLIGGLVINVMTWEKEKIQRDVDFWLWQINTLMFSVLGLGLLIGLYMFK